jgi:hypothetical protein
MLSSVLKMLPPREVNWAVLNGCFGSTQWLGVQKRAPILATKMHKSHKRKNEEIKNEE